MGTAITLKMRSSEESVLLRENNTMPPNVKLHNILERFISLIPFRVTVTMLLVRPYHTNGWRRENKNVIV